MSAENCAPQGSSPRRTPSHRRRAATDPARDIARLAASLRIAASRIAQLQRTLHKQHRKACGDQHSDLGQPAQHGAALPTQPPTDSAAEPHLNARQRRSAQRAKQWWQRRDNSYSLVFSTSPPISTAADEDRAGACPAPNISSTSADSTTTADHSAPSTVSGVREIPAPSTTAQLQSTQQLSPPPPQFTPPPAPPSVPAPAPSPLLPTMHAYTAARRPEPTGDGKRQAVESSPTLQPPGLTPITTASPAPSTTPTLPPNPPDRPHLHHLRRSRRSTPY